MSFFSKRPKLSRYQTQTEIGQFKQVRVPGAVADMASVITGSREVSTRSNDNSPSAQGHSPGEMIQNE
ncbi:hypothetical protein CC1G_02254 [Coprinopsis cinerea okayama7|uniref:Uncharacterized protein n=1 Tax=Coprinopsis cinerea (strain Okayama-7 / 130 / ATCC MYA-4618 / FGSC 9003) TaxID=240176 RepID=A8N7J7_COPC7|nr:hypothetical protein CC1G_02254 [Coprinopsis cinerea okayama7\|eukprot:XP_001830803.2 hypothetical protein CC1G_02254 [Coprinopsis cinerea okayama7\